MPPSCPTGGTDSIWNLYCFICQFNLLRSRMSLFRSLLCGVISFWSELLGSTPFDQSIWGQLLLIIVLGVNSFRSELLESVPFDWSRWSRLFWVELLESTFDCCWCQLLLTGVVGVNFWLLLESAFDWSCLSQFLSTVVGVSFFQLLLESASFWQSCWSLLLLDGVMVVKNTSDPDFYVNVCHVM